MDENPYKSPAAHQPPAVETPPLPPGPFHAFFNIAGFIAIGARIGTALADLWHDFHPRQQSGPLFAISLILGAMAGAALGRLINLKLREAATIRRLPKN